MSISSHIKMYIYIKFFMMIEKKECTWNEEGWNK